MGRSDIVLLLLAGIVGVVWFVASQDWRLSIRLRKAWSEIRPYGIAYVRSSPATFVYAAVIAFTTWLVTGSRRTVANALLQEQSTNLRNLHHHAIDVLIRSAFWSGVPYALPVVLFLAIVLAPAEFWLGTARAVLVFAIGHVGATLVTAAGIELAIRLGTAPHGIARTIDVGVSYGTFCVAALLTYRLATPWRYLWACGLLGSLALVAAIHGEFADYGHVVSVLLGFACYPLTRSARASERRRVPLYRPWQEPRADAECG